MTMAIFNKRTQPAPEVLRINRLDIRLALPNRLGATLVRPYASHFDARLLPHGTTRDVFESYQTGIVVVAKYYVTTDPKCKYHSRSFNFKALCSAVTLSPNAD